MKHDLPSIFGLSKSLSLHAWKHTVTKLGDNSKY